MDQSSLYGYNFEFILYYSSLPNANITYGSNNNKNYIYDVYFS